MTTGKSLVNDKASLLQLANDVANRKERAVQDKVNKTKTIASLRKKKDSGFNASGSHIISSSDRLRAAKELVAGRKAKQKRDKTRARKLIDGRQIVRINPGSTGDGQKYNNTLSPNGMTLKKPPTTKRVAFA